MLKASKIKLVIMNQTLTAYKIENRVFLSTGDIGTLLGYKVPRPAVLKLYHYHSKSFSPDDSLMLSLGRYKERVFSLSACVQLSSYSDMPQAPAVREALQQLL